MDDKGLERDNKVKSFPEICITRDELDALCRLPRSEVFPALRRTARARGLFYSRFELGAPKSDFLEFKTSRGTNGNLYLQNYIEGQDGRL